MVTVSSPQTSQGPQRFLLANGITLITVTNPATDVISARLFLKNAGSIQERRDQAGLSHLLSTVLSKGTKQKTSREIANQIESLGANLGAEAASDYFLMNLKTVTADFPTILALGAEILTEPTFSPTEVEREKYLTQQSIKAQQESPFNIAFNQLREAMYQEHPYSLSILGTEETVANLTPADLHQHHQQFFRPDQLVISLSGLVEPDQALAWVEGTLGDWQVDQSPPPPPVVLPPLIVKPQECFTYQDTQQAIIMLGYLGVGVQHPDYSTLKLLSTYLGNGLSSRLFVELREKRGLAYDVSAFYPTRLEASQFVVYIGTAPENKATAQAGLQSEVERLCEVKLTTEELQTAKNKLLGQYALSKQTNAEIAQIYGWYETLGLGLDFDQLFQAQIQEITPELAQQIAQKYFTVQPYVSLVGPLN